MTSEQLGTTVLSFEDELSALLNKHSKENDSNTPDFLLAKYLRRCLENFGITMSERDIWSGFRKNDS